MALFSTDARRISLRPCSGACAAYSRATRKGASARRLHEELSRETDRLISLRSVVEAELGRIPGVRGVAVAVRERAGLLSGELGFRIYVCEKRPRGEVPRGQLVPRTILGYPTDVHAIARSRAQCCGATRPLLGGLEIRTAPSFEAERMGTLGCFVTIAGVPHGLTNEHVLLATSASLTDRQIFQPKRKDVFGATCNEIGVSVQNLGFKGDFQFNGQIHFVDCAAVKLQGSRRVRRSLCPKTETSK
jgi:hypothetical protein